MKSLEEDDIMEDLIMEESSGKVVPKAKRARINWASPQCWPILERALKNARLPKAEREADPNHDDLKGIKVPDMTL